MRERAPGRDVDRVGAGLLEPAAHLHGVVDRVPAAEPEEECVRALRGADLHLQVEVVADARAHRAHGLEQQARAILERPAVLVLAIVDRRGEELREEVAVRAVDLDAVEARPRARARAAAANELVISRSCAGVARSASKPCSGSDLPVELSPLRNSIPGMSRCRPACASWRMNFDPCS